MAKLAVYFLGSGLVLSILTIALVEISTGVVPASLATVAGTCSGSLGVYLAQYRGNK